MAAKNDIHDNEKRLNWNKKKFSNSEFVNDSNKEAIQGFCQKCFAEGLSKARVKKYITNFHTILKLAPENFELENADREDIEKVVANIEKTDYAEATKSDFKAAIKKYYKLIEGEGYYYPDKVKFFTQTRDKSKIDSPDPLSKDQIKKIIEQSSNSRDRALYKLCYYGGLRPQELLSLQIKDLKFISKGVRINVKGKTGARQILVVKPKKVLREWLDEHPLSDVRDAPLWTRLKVDSDKPIEDLQLGYNHFRLNLKRLSRKADVRVYKEKQGKDTVDKTEVYPYLFRHSRATHVATEMSEAAMKAYFGWTQSSDMCEVYIHLSGRDIDDEILEMYNMDDQEDNSPNFCPNCGEALPKS